MEKEPNELSFSPIDEDICSKHSQKLEDLIESIDVSNFLHVISYEEKILIFHKLFGNPLIFSEDVLFLLDYINNPIEGVGHEIDISDIELLKSNSFIIDKGFDERLDYNKRVLELQKNVINGKAISKLDLLISEKCNLGCRHCIYFNSISLGDEERKDSLMNLYEAKKIIDKYVQIITSNGVNELDIHFGSAEPLLNWEVIKEIIEYINNEYSRYSSNISINTNLTLLTGEMADFFKEDNVTLHVSLDGEREANDAIRKFKNGKGTYDTILEKINLLKEISYPIDGISLTITNDNYNLINESFANFCKDLGLNALAFDIDLLGVLNIDGVDIDEIANKLVNIYKRCEELGIEGFGTWMHPYFNMINNSILDGEYTAFCSAMKGKGISVSNSGNITLCPYTTGKAGNIDTLNLGKNSEYGRLITSRTPGLQDFCIDCELEGHCAGMCQVSREVIQNKGEIKDLYDFCNFYKKVTFLLLQNDMANLTS